MPTKICKDCGIEKSLDEYYKHKQMADGHLNNCKTCKLKYLKNRPKQAITKIEQRRNQKPARRIYFTECCKRKRLEHPERYAAYIIVNNAIRDGKLKRRPCEICNKHKAHAHHEDYSKPLDINWLCAKHHVAHHRKRKL